MTKHVFPFENHRRYSEGVESRDFIAFIAMQGLCSNPAYILNQDGKRVLYDHINKVWRYDNADEYICETPIAWCEIPTFEV